MARMSFSTDVAAPVETVFALSTDFRNCPGRIRGITKVELLNDKPVGVGLRFRETRVMFGKEASEEMEITSFDPNRGYTLEANSCGCHYVSAFRFEPQPGGTKVTLVFEGIPQSFMAKLMAPLSWLMSGMVKKCVMQDLADLKASAEQRVAPTSI